jgi:hypothetical protein
LTRFFIKLIFRAQWHMARPFAAWPVVGRRTFKDHVRPAYRLEEWEDGKFEIKPSVDETFRREMSVIFPN